MNTMVKTYTSLTAMNALAATFAIASSVIISHIFSPEEYGRYVLFLSLVNLAALLLISWPNAALLRYGREVWTRDGQLGEALASRFVFYACGLAVAGLLAWGFSSQIAIFLDTKTNPLLLLFVGVCIFPLSEVGIYAAQSTGRFLSGGYAPLINRTVFLAGLVAVMIFPWQRDWKTLAGFFLTAAAVSSAVAFVYLPSNAWGGFRSTRSMIGRILRYSWAIPIGAVSAYTVNWVDAWVIRAYLGTKEVGVYTWAYQVVAVASLALTPLVALFSPRMIDARLEGETEVFTRHVERGTRILILFSAFLVASATLIAPLMGFLGESYQGTYIILLILISALPVQFIGYWVTPISSAYENLVPRIVTVSVGLAVINTFGDLLLVPLLGIQGAAFATVVAFAFGAISQVWLLQRHIPELSSQRIGYLLLLSGIAPVGILLLWAGGPVMGVLWCSLWAAFVIILARGRRVFSMNDVHALAAQSLPGILKGPLIIGMQWLALGKRDAK